MRASQYATWNSSRTADTASLAGMFLYYGFEACGDVAEETPNPSKKIPVAMRMTIYIGGIAAMFACLALILAVPRRLAEGAAYMRDPATKWSGWPGRRTAAATT